jgi:hypothetical protein
MEIKIRMENRNGIEIKIEIEIGDQDRIGRWNQIKIENKEIEIGNE